MSAWSDRQRDWRVIDAAGKVVQFGETVYDPQGKRFATFYGITREPAGPSRGKVLLSPGDGAPRADAVELYPFTHGLRIERS